MNKFKSWRQRRNLELSDSTINELIEKCYPNKLPNTKELIKQYIKENGKGSEDVRGWIAKDDLLDEFKRTRQDTKLTLNYDFDKIPGLIRSKLEKFTIICRNTILGVEVGEFETDFLSFIEKRREIFRPKTIQKILDKSLSISISKTEAYKKELIKLFGDRYDYSMVVLPEQNIVLPIKIKCNKCGKWFWVNPVNFLKTGNCPNCRLSNPTIQVTFNIWKQRAINTHGVGRYDYTTASNQYHEMRDKLTIRCNVCGNVFEQTGVSHLSCEIACPKCRNHNSSVTRNKEGVSIFDRILDIAGPDYDFSNSNKLVTTRDCITFIEKRTGRSITNRVESILRGHVDPTINMSSLELLCFNWLTSKSISFNREVVVKGLNGREKDFVRIDYVMENYRGKTYWIELNGIQHYHEINFLHMDIEGRYTFEQQLIRDNSIKEYCTDRGITLVVIPYTYCSYKLMDEILTAIFIDGKNPEDIITIPPIIYK